MIVRGDIRKLQQEMGRVQLELCTLKEQVKRLSEKEKDMDMAVRSPEKETHGYVAIRRNLQTKVDYIDAMTFDKQSYMAKTNALAEDKKYSHWAKVNPVQRIIKARLTLDED